MGERKQTQRENKLKKYWPGKGFLVTNVRAPEYKHRPVRITNMAVLNCKLYSSVSKRWEIQVSNAETLSVLPTIAFDETVLKIKAKIALPFWSSLTTSFAVLTGRLTNREICQNVCCTFRAFVFRGTQRLFSVQHLFGKAKIA